MSDTPRTDALLETILDRAGQVGPRNCKEEWVALCRTLESELKDARQIASKYDDRYFATRELLTVSTERAERLERELNEARTRIKRLEDVLEKAELAVAFANREHGVIRMMADDYTEVLQQIRVALKAKEAKP